MATLSKNELYSIYQGNRKLLEVEMKQVKAVAIQKIGKLEWEKRNFSNRGLSGPSVDGQIANDQIQVKAATRLYTCLLCSWLEAKLCVIEYEPSAVGFSDLERDIIRKHGAMADKWKKCFNLALFKGCSISYSGYISTLKENHKSLFSGFSSIQRNYDVIFQYMDLIETAVYVRNRLAHGQWETQLNQETTDYAEPKIVSFINTYDNIMKLDLLFQIYKEIAEIISSYVVYKDRETTRNVSFEFKIDGHMKKIEQINTQLQTKSFSKYCEKLYAQELAKREMKV